MKIFSDYVKHYQNLSFPLTLTVEQVWLGLGPWELHWPLARLSFVIDHWPTMFLDQEDSFKSWAMWFWGE